MKSLAHRQVAEAVDALLLETPPLEVCDSLLELQFSLVQKAERYRRNDLVKAALKDGWFLGYWALKTQTEISEESARNLVTPANVMHDTYWRSTKQELGTAMGMVNPFFLDLSPTMLNIDPDTGHVSYNQHAERIIERISGDQSRDERIAAKASVGCPHGIIGMSRFLINYLDFMNTHVSQPTPVAAMPAAV